MRHVKNILSGLNLSSMIKMLICQAFLLSGIAILNSTATASTLYVGNSGQLYTTIQSAIDAASEGDTIVVSNGIYFENLKILKSVILKSENGYEYTTIEAADTTNWVISISQTSGAVLDGFTIYGTMYSDDEKAAIFMGGKYNVVCNNCVGIDRDHSSNHGIYICPSARNNCISNNIINNNSGYGIWLYNTSGHIITGNQCSQAKILNERASGNTYYFNDCNEKIGALTPATNNFNTPVKVSYQYNDGLYSNYLGNHYRNLVTNDANGDGIGDTQSDNYALVATSDHYLIQAWWFDCDGIMYRDDRTKKVDSLKLDLDAPLIWITDERLSNPLNFSNEGWTGQFFFTTPIAKYNKINLQIGYSPDGKNFIAGGPSMDVVGDSINHIFSITTNNSAFSVPGNQYLALQLTNASLTSYYILTGGAFSFISSPGKSDPLPVELVSFFAAISEGGVILEWQTITETNNYGFEIEHNLAACWESIGFVRGKGTTTEVQRYSFFDKLEDIKPDIRYRLKQVDFDGTANYSQVITATLILPHSIELLQNHPNPFNSGTDIRYKISTSNDVKLTIYNSLGQEIQTLVDKFQPQGEYLIRWEGMDNRGQSVTSGNYFCVLKVANEKIISKPMMLIR